MELQEITFFNKKIISDICTKSVTPITFVKVKQTPCYGIRT